MEQPLAGGRITSGVVRVGDNVILHNGQPVALIDFGFAAPGHPVEDLAYAAWSWCLASKPERQPATDQARQVALLATMYGASTAVRRWPRSSRGTGASWPTPGRT